MLKLIRDGVSFVFQNELKNYLEDIFVAMKTWGSYERILKSSENAHLIAIVSHMPLNGQKVARVYWLSQSHDCQSKDDHVCNFPKSNLFLSGYEISK